MNSIKNMLLLSIFLTVVVSGAHAQSLNDFKLIAHYPLVADANDATGTCAPAELINTPFADGGVYCNGNYLYGDPDSCYVGTPSIDGLTTNRFAVSARFKISDNDDKRRPIFVCGNSYRWLFVFIDNAEMMGFGVNDTFSHAGNAKVIVAKDVWHTVTALYDSAQAEAILFFNGVAMDTISASLNHGNDRTLSVVHSGTGNTFKGYLADIKFYAHDETAGIASKSATPEVFCLHQNYPNPFNPTTTIEFSVQQAGDYELALFTTSGRKVRTLIKEHLQVQTYSLMFTASDLSSGIYICQLHGEGQSQVRRLVLLK
jgi:hypothetical protein